MSAWSDFQLIYIFRTGRLTTETTLRLRRRQLSSTDARTSRREGAENGRQSHAPPRQ